MGSSSNNGTGGVPPGFRFHPTDEELLHYYLKKKVSFHKFEMEVIRDVDLNKLEPWDLQEKCRIGWTPQNEWYFFSHKDRKYPTGSRTNRATNAGFWKATGRDKCIRNSFQKIGMRKTLVFYRGRAPHGQKTDWIMHEYRLEDSDQPDLDHSHQEDGWVICRVFKKKNLFKIAGLTNEGGRGGGSDESSTITTTCTNNNNLNNINNNSSSTISPDHHQLLLNTTASISTNNNNITQVNLQYYNLLPQQPSMPHHLHPHHYLMATQQHNPGFEQNNKPDHHNNTAITTLHHSYVPHSHYCSSSSEGQPASNHHHQQDQWSMFDRIVTTNVTTTTTHNDGRNADEDDVLLSGPLTHTSSNNVTINNGLSLDAPATANVTISGTTEMDFWGGYAK